MAGDQIDSITSSPKSCVQCSIFETPPGMKSSKCVLKFPTIEMVGNGKLSTTEAKKSFLKMIVDNIPAFGILCSLASVICFSFSTVIVKLLESNYNLPGIQVLVARSLIQFIVCGFVIFYNGFSFWGKSGSRLMLFCRAVTGTISLGCIYTAFNMIPIGDATTIYLSSPVLVTVFAYFSLGESFSLIQFITCLLTIVGVLFITKPAFIFPKKTDFNYPLQTYGQVLAIVGALGSAITFIKLRKLKTSPAAVVVFWFAAFCGLISVIMLFALDMQKPINFADFHCTGLLLVIGLLSVCDQYFLTLALQHEDASTISVIRSFNIVLAFLWEVTLFHETVTWTSIVGAVLVTICIVVLASSKSITSIRQYRSEKRKPPADMEQAATATAATASETPIDQSMPK